jgi:hypothetical protein
VLSARVRAAVVVTAALGLGACAGERPSLIGAPLPTTVRTIAPPGDPSVHETATTVPAEIDPTQPSGVSFDDRDPCAAFTEAVLTTMDLRAIGAPERIDERSCRVATDQGDLHGVFTPYAAGGRLDAYLSYTEDRDEVIPAPARLLLSTYFAGDVEHGPELEVYADNLRVRFAFPRPLDVDPQGVALTPIVAAVEGALTGSPD